MNFFYILYKKKSRSIKIVINKNDQFFSSFFKRFFKLYYIIIFDWNHVIFSYFDLNYYKINRDIVIKNGRYELRVC